MMKRLIFTALILAMVVSCSVLQANSLQQADKFEDAISASIAEIKELLLPFGAAAGFPDVRPARLENATYEQLYRAAATRSRKSAKILTELISNHDFPWRIEYSAKYFIKRLEIASYLYPEMQGNEKVFEHLCRDFASACDRGFEELRQWGIRETLAVDIIWFKNIQQNFKQVTEKMKKASLPATIDPENAREEWRKAAIALTEAGNAAGLASTKIGSGGLAAFPAWRLKLAIKYFKAASKAAVMDMWHSRQTSANIWLSACDKLRRDIARIDREMQHFLKTHGGDEQTSTQRQVASPYAMAAAASTPMYSTSQQDPIEIKASASDKGLSVEIGQDSLVIVGVAEGPEPAYDIFGLPVGDYARSVRFTLDIDKAPTTNIFGQTDYSIKNRRIFLVYTSKGATALQMAQALARKVNDGRDFRASAHPLSPDRAQLNFTRR